MSSISGAKLMVRALAEEKVPFVLGIPGTHNIEFYDALVDEASIKTILVTDEQCASFMADGMARASNKMAALCLVPGAGLTHALSGIAECFMDKIPLLVIATGVRDDFSRAYQLHDIDQLAVAKSVCKKAYRVKNISDVYVLLREASAEARAYPCGPVVVEIPANFMMFSFEFNENIFSTSFDRAVAKINRAPDEIIQTLASSKNIGIYAGWGAKDASLELFELAEKLDALVFTTITGKGIYPENSPRWAWNVLGRAAPDEIQSFENDFDCLLAIGCRFAEVGTASYGLKPPKNLIHIDIDPEVFGKNYPCKHSWASDSLTALQSLLRETSIFRNSDSAKLSRLKESQLKISARQELEYKQSEKVSPVIFIRALQKYFGPETVFVTDSGNGTFIAMENLRLLRPNSFLAPVDYSCMGYSIPAMIGAKLACPERPVVGLIGDGAFLMTGMELVTARRFGAGAIACILNDGELSQIAQFQRRSLVRSPATELSIIDYEKFAQALGLSFVSIKNNSEIEGGIRQAKEFATNNNPVLVDVWIDYASPTYFTKGAIKTHILRLDWRQKLQVVGRVVKRMFFSLMP